MGPYCHKQLETTFHQFCEKPLHITSEALLTTSSSVLLPSPQATEE